MTANPFAAMLDGVPRYFSSPGLVGMVKDSNGGWVRLSEVLAALAAAVPDDLAEAGKVLERIYVGDPVCEEQFLANEAADLITALLARIAAQEAQIKGLEERLKAETLLYAEQWAENHVFRGTLTDMTKERDEWKDAATRHHPNPVDHRYWEGRYRDEAAALAAERAKVAKLVEALNRIRNAWPIVRDADCSGGTLVWANSEIDAAITEAGQ